VLRPFGGPRKAIALLAYLLLHRDRTLSRAAIAEQFWPDEDDQSGRASLRRHLHRALSALPEAEPSCPWVLADKVTVRWNPDAPLVLDTMDYERRCSEGDLDSAVSLYRGDYLEDFYDDWVLPERERLRSIQAANLAALVDRYRGALDYPAAIASAQSLLRLDPLREDAIRRLMSLRFAAGDRSGALSDFEIFARRLHDELAAEPMPETIALREAIRSNEHSTLEGTAAPARMTASAPRFAFTGRAAALQTLRRAWETAARGSATTSIVSGEAGIGKSRLIGELVALAESQGGRVMFGTTATIETEPYQPIAEALRGALPLLRLDRLEPIKVAALASLVPGVRDLATATPALTELEPERDRQRLFDAVETAIAHIVEKRPLLIVLEDLHWAGAATIELLDFLERRLSGKSLLLVVSFREEEVDGTHPLRPFLRRLDDARSNHTALGPLAIDDVRALVASAAPGLSESYAGTIFAASDGNALFVTELLQERLSGSASEEALPAGIVGTVTSRVNRLTQSARLLAETAAVTGAGFDVEVVRQVCGWSFAEVFDALDELVDRALVRASPHRRGDFAFSHQLVHAAVYGLVDDDARRGLHRRVGRTLEHLFGERRSLDATIARHYDSAGLAEEAVPRYIAAARYALGIFAQADAIALASRALDIGATDLDRFELHGLREEAAVRAGDTTLRTRDCLAMTQIARTLGDEEREGIALRRTFATHVDLADLEKAETVVIELRDLSDRTESPRLAVTAAIAYARLAFNRGEQHAAETVLIEVEPSLAAIEGDSLAFEYWFQRAFNAVWAIPVAAPAYIDQARVRAGEDRMLAARLLRVEAQLADARGDARDLRRLASDLLEIYREIGDIEGQATAHRNLAMAAWYAFDLSADREHTDRALELYERVQKPNSIAGVYFHYGYSAVRVGDFARAERDLLHARSIWQSLSIAGNACTATIALAWLEWLRGDDDCARDHSLEALAVAREHRIERLEIDALGQLGAAERLLGQSELALEHLDAALRWRRGRDPRMALETLVELIALYVTRGDHDRAAAAATELLDGLADEYTRVSFPAYALSTAAAAFEAAGQIERAQALRTQANLVLHDFAARIPDETSRIGYLELRVNRL
jgi:DNA-binding SARP family transcriptional activator